MTNAGQLSEVEQLKARIAELTDRVIAAESSNVAAADLARENAELRKQLAAAPTTEAAVAQLREWVPDYQIGATHVAMPVAMAWKLLAAIDGKEAK